MSLLWWLISKSDFQVVCRTCSNNTTNHSEVWWMPPRSIKESEDHHFTCSKVKEKTALTSLLIPVHQYSNLHQVALTGKTAVVVPLTAPWTTSIDSKLDREFIVAVTLQRILILCALKRAPKCCRNSLSGLTQTFREISRKGAAHKGARKRLF